MNTQPLEVNRSGLPSDSVMKEVMKVKAFFDKLDMDSVQTTLDLQSSQQPRFDITEVFEKNNAGFVGLLFTLLEYNGYQMYTENKRQYVKKSV